MNKRFNTLTSLHFQYFKLLICQKLQWIKGYAKKYNNPKLFYPHITIGFGETDKF